MVELKVVPVDLDDSVSVTCLRILRPDIVLSLDYDLCQRLSLVESLTDEADRDNHETNNDGHQTDQENASRVACVFRLFRFVLINRNHDFNCDEFLDNLHHRLLDNRLLDFRFNNWLRFFVFDDRLWKLFLDRLGFHDHDKFFFIVIVFVESCDVLFNDKLSDRVLFGIPVVEEVGDQVVETSVLLVDICRAVLVAWHGYGLTI